jgi:hypothetical protein
VLHSRISFAALAALVCATSVGCLDGSGLGGGDPFEIPDGAVLLPDGHLVFPDVQGDDGASAVDIGGAEDTSGGGGPDGTGDTAEEVGQEDASEDTAPVTPDAGPDDVATDPDGDAPAPDADATDPDVYVPKCGNGVLDEGELCDGDCPSVCDDGDPCSLGTLTGSAEGCDAWCAFESGVDSGSDLDGDNLTDCSETGDGNPFTDPLVWNGLTATAGEPPEGFFTSAQCDLFFGDDFGEMYGLFDDSSEVQNIWQGWEYQAGNTNDYSSTEDFDFEPPWPAANNQGVWGSFQMLFSGTIYVDAPGIWCFSADTGSGGIGPGDIAGRRNCCGRIYIDANITSKPLVETGYGSSASPDVGCVDLDAGPHLIDIAARHYETYFYAPKLLIRHCYGDASTCIPDVPIPQTSLQAAVQEAVCEPSCVGKQCGSDGCAGSCGVCGAGKVCEAGQCKASVCEPACGSAECGPDGCGGSCGECGAAEVCEAGTCEPTDVPPPDGACTNSADQGIIDMLGSAGLEAAITDCGTGCFFASGDKAQCVIDCMTDDIGLSAECAGCFGLVTGCALEHCALDCINAGPGCDQCMAEFGCQDDFPACSGLPPG